MATATRRPAQVFPPGDFLREELEARGWTQTDLADILDRPVHVVNEIIMGKRGITPETAKGLAAALGTSPEFWLNLEAAYQLWRVRSRDGENDAVARRAKLYSFAPVKEMTRRHWIEASDNLDVLVKRVLDFFDVSSLDDAPAFVGCAARKSTSYNSISRAQLAWLFRAKNIAQAVHAGPFSKGQVAEAITGLRSLLYLPEEIRHVPQVLRDAGMRLVIVEALPGTRIDGACFWLDDSPVIALSMRYDRIDCFWHTLMHELGHIANGDGLTLDTDLEGNPDGREKPERERMADQFATSKLIPQDALNSFIARVRPRYSVKHVEAFAQTCQVHPGIVVGQLHHRGELEWTHLRKMLVPVREIAGQTALTDGWGTSVPAAP